MTIVPWPSGDQRRRPEQDQELIVDPLPKAILHGLVADLPGPKGETEAERAIRFEAQLAEVLRYNPRNSAEAMLATQCILLRLMLADSRHDAGRPDLTPGLAKKLLQHAKEFRKLIGQMEQALASRQAQPAGGMDVRLALALGLGEYVIPDPAATLPAASVAAAKVPAAKVPAAKVPAIDGLADYAVSAVIVPLHPAPKMLQ